MNEFLEFLVSNNGAAFAIALIIFIITLVLIFKRIIGFFFTIILLAFALISGFFVANADLLREILKGFTPSGTPEDRETLVQLKNQFYKSIGELKQEFQDQKAEFQKIIDREKIKTELKVEPKPEVIPSDAKVIPQPKPAETPAPVIDTPKGASLPE